MLWFGLAKLAERGVGGHNALQDVTATTQTLAGDMVLRTVRSFGSIHCNNSFASKHDTGAHAELKIFFLGANYVSISIPIFFALPYIDSKFNCASF